MCVCTIKKIYIYMCVCVCVCVFVGLRPRIAFALSPHTVLDCTCRNSYIVDLLQSILTCTGKNLVHV